MKQTVKKLLKSGICLMLVFCMLLGFAPAATLTAQAAEDEQEALIYVSIGDSMTNGYCLPGYDGSSGAINYAMETYANKFAAYLAGYTGTIADDQVIFTGSNGTVDHRQLALSGMRAEDIEWILELNYEDTAFIRDQLYPYHYEANTWNSSRWYGTLGFTAGDDRTWGDFMDYNFRYADAAAKILQVYNTGNNGKYFTSSFATADEIQNAKNGLAADPYFPEGTQVSQIGGYKYLQIATEYYQKSMEDADIISLAVGNTNFGTFMLSHIMDVVMSDDMSFSQTYKIEEVRAIADPVSLAKIDAMLASDAYKAIEAYCATLGETEAKKTEIKHIVKYCMSSYINGYIGMLDAILEKNPDAQIIMIALMNAYENKDGTVDEGTLGDLVQVIYTPVNAFLKTLAEEMAEKYPHARFSFAEAPYVSCMVDVYGDDFYTEADGDAITYPGLLDGTKDYKANEKSVVRARFVEEVLYGGFMFAAMGRTAQDSTIDAFLKGVIAYDMMTPAQKAAFAANDADRATDYALYLAFENSLIRSGTENITMSSLVGLSDIGGIFQAAYPAIQQAIGAASANQYDNAYAGLAILVEKSLEAQIAAQGYAIDVTVTGGDIKNVITAEGDEARLAAAKVIAENAAMEIFVPIAVNTAADGIETVFETIVATVESGNLSGVGYYNYLYPDAKLTELDFAAKRQLLADWANDSYTWNGSTFEYNPTYAKLKGYLATAYGDAMAGLILKTALGDTESAKGFALIAQYGLMLQHDAMIRAAINEHEDLGPVVAQIAVGISGNSALNAENVANLAYLLAVPQTMSNELYNNTDFRGALAMNARVLLGTGAGGHPSAAGHQALYKAVLNREHIGVIYGDVNGDGEITLRDLTLLRQYLSDYDYDTETSTVQVSTGADCNSDGKIDLNDLKPLREYFVN